MTMNAASESSPRNAQAKPVRRRPALPCGYEPPDYRVVPVRLGDGTVLHVNADDLADPRHVNVRNLLQEFLPFSPYRREGSNGQKWGPLEWEPHQLGDEAEKAVMDHYKKNFIKGDRRFPLDTYFHRQGMSTPQELRQQQ